MKTPLRLGVVGWSRAGAALAAAFSCHVHLAGVWNRSPNLKSLPAHLPSFGTLAELAETRPDIWLVSVADSAIRPVAEQLSKVTLAGAAGNQPAAFHLSGVLPGQELRSGGYSGPVASLHPVRSFPEHQFDPKALVDCLCGIEGDESVVQKLVDLVFAAGGTGFRLDGYSKAHYHLAAAVISNGPAALYDLAARALEKAGITPEIKRQVLRNLATNSIENLSRFGAESALTGPVVRGDIPTLERHFAALDSDAESSNFYRVLCHQLLNVARKGHPERAELYDDLEEFLDE